MKKTVSVLTVLLFFVTFSGFGQASVAYYPFNSLFSVSTNPNRQLWLDARVQTNTLFGSLSTTLAPMVTISRQKSAAYYAGAGIRFNALNTLVNEQVLEGYSLHAGVRIAPIASIPNLRVAFEMSPFARRNFKSGILYSYLGVVYQFGPKE
ncbi:hypothetical protein GCM10023189_17960 [Nibrella saemangeumensis]|uniref:Outer membrane protein beta-barrel domain-containing protein n=1 Tax=Nibrella saemangeumensis TaxID=1084526 RepID=A0ABP8MN69_9BACT